MSIIRNFLGINKQSQEELWIIEELNNGYKTMKIVGRGTVVVDPKEVSDNIHAHGMYDKAKKLVLGK